LGLCSVRAAADKPPNSAHRTKAESSVIRISHIRSFHQWNTTFTIVHLLQPSKSLHNAG
jgi:hypothetical protein